MKNKKSIIISIIIIVSLIVTGIGYWYTKIHVPYNNAVNAYNEIVSSINEKNIELDKEINKLESLLDSGNKPFDITLIDTSKEIIKQAKVSKVLIGDMPEKTEDIIARTTELSTPIDYSEIIIQLNDMYNTLDVSIKQYKQLTNPSEDFVIQRLLTIDEVIDAAAVTEDNDPNGQLNKAGGYTATVYFESTNVDQNEVYGEDVIDKGTDAGGAVEVYANEENANKRNEYLSTFDGSIFSSGSHRVVGTIVVRTSDKLTASKQKALEEKIINALSTLK